jgi:hypothetical protein
MILPIIQAAQVGPPGKLLPLPQRSYFWYPLYRRTGHYRMYCSHYLAHRTQSSYRISCLSNRTGDTPGSSISFGPSYYTTGSSISFGPSYQLGDYTRLSHR